MKVRAPAVAGLFYPGEPDELRAAVRRYLAEASATGEGARETDRSPASGHRLTALVAPHAGYVYSGPVAATAYRLLADDPGGFSRVVLLGPSHRVAFDGIAVSGAHAFETPLGLVPVDEEGAREALAFECVGVLDDAHALEHSLEVHLPFLQIVLPRAKVLPLVVGSASAGEVSAVLEAVGRDPDTLIVVSTDLSHYHDYETARRIDAETTQLIEELSDHIRPEQACGCQPLNGLLHLARGAGHRVRTLDLRNSGDTAGPRDRVVGYGAYALH